MLNLPALCKGLKALAQPGELSTPARKVKENRTEKLEETARRFCPTNRLYLPQCRPECPRKATENLFRRQPSTLGLVVMACEFRLTERAKVSFSPGLGVMRQTISWTSLAHTAGFSARGEHVSAALQQRVTFGRRG
jgi:hypothetical protein